MMREITAAIIRGALSLVVMVGALAMVIAFSFSVLVYALAVAAALPGFLWGRVVRWRSSATASRP